MSTNDAENEKDPRTDAPSGEPEVGGGGDAAAEASGEAEASATPAAEAETPAAETESPAPAAAGEAPAKQAAPTGTKPASKAAALTPGQRLAAARAAKAQKKTATRGREADLREQRAIDTAEVVREKAVSYLDTNRRVIWGAIGAIVLVGAIAFGVKKWQDGEEQAAGALLEAANRVQLAEIRSEGERAEAEDDDAPTFATRAARAEAALRKYREVTRRYPRTDAAVWAFVGEGRALLDRGEPAEARAAYQKAVQAGGDDPAVTRQALEGIGFSYEAEENWDEALDTYEELAGIANGTYESWGDYHAARMLLKKGNQDQAKERLRAVLERLRADDAPGAPYLRRQVEARLAVIDPTFTPQGGGGGGMGGQLSPEQLQELIRQAQARQGEPSGTP